MVQFLPKVHCLLCFTFLTQSNHVRCHLEVDPLFFGAPEFLSFYLEQSKMDLRGFVKYCENPPQSVVNKISSHLFPHFHLKYSIHVMHVKRRLNGSRTEMWL